MHPSGFRKYQAHLPEGRGRYIGQLIGLWVVNALITPFAGYSILGLLLFTLLSIAGIVLQYRLLQIGGWLPWKGQASIPSYIIFYSVATFGVFMIAALIYLHCIAF